jgi:hypothetical protein
VDTAYLLKRRAAVVGRHEVLESVQGSGYHPDDEQARDEQRKKRKPLSQRPVAIQHDGRAWLCGPDVPAIRATLKEWVEKFRAGQAEHKESAAAAGIEPSAPPPQAKQAEAVSARVAAETSAVIELPNQEFNAILFGLNEMGVQIVTTGVLP